ncbi:fructose-specific PTS transporter subunit EIIC [Streptomyces geranii]|uniref:fructose-specific PTS transporter subunit EIIC n=1 Tax=Streptomyces geranii TaxID=2058923 RepID=UPI001E60DCCA|nr:fructose-specific PTS transporter subunit EIIC [Streptomyces geranii]
MSHSRTSAGNPATPMNQGGAQGRHIGIRLGAWLASSVPYFGPVTGVAALLYGLALVIAGSDINATVTQILNSGAWFAASTWTALGYQTGATVLLFLPPAAAGYLAYGIAGRAGVVPAVIGGIAVSGVQGGVPLGLVAGAVAGAVTVLLRRVTAPPKLRGITHSVLTPLLASAASAFVAVALCGTLFDMLLGALEHPMIVLQFKYPVTLGLLLGLMVCSDFGGPLNKAALSFAMIGVGGNVPANFSQLNMSIMAAVMAAGAVPALGLSLASLVRGKVFSQAERDYGKCSWLFGLISLPEGAIPFVIADPLRTIPASMAGSGVAGALVMQFSTTVSVPFGGFLNVGAMGKPFLFALAVAAGVLTTAALAIGLKSLRRTPAPAKSVKRARGSRKMVPTAV